MSSPVVKVLSSKVSVSSGGLDLEDTLLNGEERDIESSSSEIEDENVLLANGLLVESVGDGGGGGLVDDTEDVHARDDTGILGGLTLRVVEVGGNGDDCWMDGVSFMASSFGAALNDSPALVTVVPR